MRSLKLVASALMVVVLVTALFLLRQGAENVAEQPLNAVFIGDSYTAGVGASSATTRWTTLVAAATGWQEDNRGLGGTGYVSTAGTKGCGQQFCGNYQAAAAEIRGDQPDVIVVAGGQNDFDDWARNPDQVSAAIQGTYRELRRNHPKATLVAVGPSDVDRAGPIALALDHEVREAATSVGAHYVSLLDPLTIQKDMVLPDGAHVNDAGHQAIAERVLEGVRH